MADNRKVYISNENQENENPLVVTGQIISEPKANQYVSLEMNSEPIPEDFTQLGCCCALRCNNSDNKYGCKSASRLFCCQEKGICCSCLSNERICCIWDQSSIECICKCPKICLCYRQCCCWECLVGFPFTDTFMPVSTVIDDKLEAGDIYPDTIVVPHTACCCTIDSIIWNCTDIPRCCGSFGLSVNCCGLIESKQVSLKYYGKAFEKSNPEFCCLYKKNKCYCINLGQCTVCCKARSQACCCDRRCACPCDQDVPCMLFCLPFCSCCVKYGMNCRCCANIDVLLK